MITKESSDLYCFHFSGTMTWQQFEQYHIDLKAMNPPPVFVVIAIFDHVHYDSWSLAEVLQYANRVKNTIVIPHTIMVNVSVSFFVLAKLMSKIAPGMVEHVHYARSIPKARALAREILSM